VGLEEIHAVAHKRTAGGAEDLKKLENLMRKVKKYSILSKEMHLMKYVTVVTNKEGTFFTDYLNRTGNFFPSTVG